MLRFNFVPNVRCKLGHSLDVNLGSRSDTIDTGTPWSLTTSLMYNFASLSTKSVALIDKNKTDFVSRSTISHMASLPFFPLGNLNIFGT